MGKKIHETAKARMQVFSAQTVTAFKVEEDIFGFNINALPSIDNR